MDQYLRKVRVTFSGGGSLVINPGSDTDNQIKVAFRISKGLSSKANSASIEIYNLSEGSRRAIGREFDLVTVEAGYIPPTGGSNIGVIFRGNLRDVFHRREGTETITEMQCGDGDQALRRAVISKTFPKGTKVTEVLEELYSEMSKYRIDRGEWKGAEDLPPFKRPLSTHCDCRLEMDRIGRSHRLYWSIQNHVLEVIPGNGFIGSAAILTPQTGLIGTPTVTDNGVKAEALLNPQIAPGRPVQIYSDTMEMNSEGGLYRAGNVDFEGDNLDGDFKVVVHGESIAGGKVNEGDLL